MMVASLSAFTCKGALELKEQHLEEIYHDFRKNREKILKELGTPTINKNIEANLNLTSLSADDSLTQLFISELSEISISDFESAAYIQALVVAANNVQMLISARNSWLKSFTENTSKRSEAEQFAIFFGYQIDQSRIDLTYLSTIEQLYQQNDDLIIFSYRLYRSLLRAFLEAREQIPSRHRNAIKMRPLDFSIDASKGLFPQRPVTVLSSNKRAPERLPFETLRQHHEAILDELVPYR